MLHYPEDNTDDEQEDLPYDGDLQHICQPHCVLEHLGNLTSVDNASPGLFTLTSPEICNHLTEKSECTSPRTPRKIRLASLPGENDVKSTMVTKKALPAGDFSCPGRNQCLSSSKMSDVLLRHFPKEEFCPLIDSETIPEISLTESVDETILNQMKSSKSTGLSLAKEENVKLELYGSERGGKGGTDGKAWDLIDQFVIEEKNNFSCEKKGRMVNNQQFVMQKEDTTKNELKHFSNKEEKKYLLQMSGSSQNHKHGQSQVHHPLPDFSKVAPKVRIPKGINKLASITKRTKYSPNAHGMSAIVKDVLEGMNSLEPVAVKDLAHEGRIPEIDQQLELLTKQAEALNHIDLLRFNNKLFRNSNSHSSNVVIKSQDRGVTSVPSVTLPMRPVLGLPQSSLPVEVVSQSPLSSLPSAAATNQSFMNHPPLQKPTEMEKISQMLKEQTEKLKTKVENFSKCVAQNIVPIEDCHQFFMLLKEHLALLEQNYLTMKEKHGVLQLHNNKHSSADIGEFDPDRKVEGEIFKLEMLLEDIKEKVDMKQMLHSMVTVKSPSLTPCDSLCSSLSSRCESPVVSSVDSPSKTTIGMKVSDNENYGEDRNHPMEVMQGRIFQTLNSGGSEKARRLQSQRQFKPIPNDSGDQENKEGNLCCWEMRTPTNQVSNTTDFTVLKEKDHCLTDAQENQAKENILIRPKLKIQLSSKQMCSCSSSRTKSMEYRKMNRRKSDCERFSDLEGKTALDSSGSELEDNSFCSFVDNSTSRVILEQKSNRSCKLHLKEQNKALSPRDLKTHFHADSQGNNYIKECKECEISYSQKESTALQRIYTTNQAEQVTDRHSDRYARTYDTIIRSSQSLTSRNTHEKRSTNNLRKKHIKDTDTKILNSTLDHVIQTANNLKRTTEHMIQVVAEDLAKAKTQMSNSASINHSTTTTTTECHQRQNHLKVTSAKY